MGNVRDPTGVSVRDGLKGLRANLNRTEAAVQYSQPQGHRRRPGRTIHSQDAPSPPVTS